MAFNIISYIYISFEVTGPVINLQTVKLTLNIDKSFSREMNSWPFL